MTRRFAILDVFTDEPLAGNSLAVVLDCDGLDDARMQAIAREFNLSETVFVLPPQNPVHSLRARIFTPAYELPFAGHPTIGTAALHALLAARTASDQKERVVLLEEEIGPVRCGVFLQDEKHAHGIFDLPRLAEAVDVVPDRDALAGALGLTQQEIGFENHEPSAFDAGVPYAFVPVRDLAALEKATPDPAHWARAFGTAGHAAAYVYTRQVTRPDRHFRARMFVPESIGEDPATGSAAAAFTGAIHRFDALPNGGHRFVVEQGFEMGRPSLIVVEMDVLAGAITSARIGGDAVLVAEGTIDI